MSNSKIRALVRWSWLLLLAICLGLFFELRSLREETQTIQAAAKVSDEQAAALREKIAIGKTDRPTASAPVPASKKAADGEGGALTFISDGNALGDPEYRRVIARRQRRYAMANYRPVVDALHLRRADEDRLKQLLAKKWTAREDASDIIQRMGSASAELRDKAYEEAEAGAVREMKTLLGDDGYAQMEANLDASSQIKMNWIVAADFWDAGLPLTADQQVAFARTEQQVDREFGRQGSRAAPDPATGLTESDLALLRAASSFLSPEQAAYLRETRIAAARYEQAVRAMSQRGGESGAEDR